MRFFKNSMLVSFLLVVLIACGNNLESIDVNEDSVDQVLSESQITEPEPIEIEDDLTIEPEPTLAKEEESVVFPTITSEPTAPSPATSVPDPTTTATSVPTSIIEQPILFVSRRGNDVHVYLMDIDGSKETRLTDDEYNDELGPVWSPDRSKIAFSYFTPNGERGIYLINLDSFERTQIELGELGFILTDWSPDGSRILGDSGLSLSVINADGSDPFRLADDAFNATWSPDSSRIFFVSRRDGNAELYVMNSDGSDVTRLTDTSDNPIGTFLYSLSPDGSQIAYSYFAPNGSIGIFIMNEDGSNSTILTDMDGINAYPVWSPDGSRILFVSEKDRSQELYLINPDGTEINQLTNNGGFYSQIGWTPDGSHILVSKQVDNDWEIFVMNADGSEETRLTYNLEGYDYAQH